MKVIYTITSILKPERIYVGSASNFKRRRSCHLNALRFNKHHSPLLQNHYNKYGVDDLIFKIIEEVNENISLLDREQYYLDTLTLFFNVQKIANLPPNRKGSKLSEKHKEILSNKMKGNQHALGNKLTNETKAKMSHHRKGVPLSQKCKDNISNGNKGKVGSRKGLKWSKSKKEQISKSLYNMWQNSPRNKRVARFDLNGIKIDEFKSVSDAARSLNTINRGAIHNVCNGKRKTSLGYIWKFL